jgi:hypothetical protein
MRKNPLPQQYTSNPAPRNCQKRHDDIFQKGRRGWSQEGQREGLELDNRMCCHHVKSEPRTQTFSLHAANARTSKTVMWGGLRKTAVALVVRRVRNGAFVRRYHYISCVRTKVHMFTCLFLHICLHMTYTNVILRNMWIMTFLTTKLDEASVHPWNKMVFRMTPETFLWHKKTHEVACSHTKDIQITRQTLLLWDHHRTSEVAVSLTPSLIADLVVRTTWKSVL